MVRRVSSSDAVNWLARLFWAVLARHWRVEVWVLALSFVAEVLIRAFLLQRGADFVAYMLITNWMTVFLLGKYFGQQEGRGKSPRSDLALCVGALAAVLVLWPRFAGSFEIDSEFPFSTIRAGGEAATWLATR